MSPEAHNLLASIAPLWLEPTTGRRIVAKSRRTYRSKRARRQAFYGNQKVARRKVYGNATGECLASPPRPPGLPEPGPKKGPTA